MFLMSSLKIFLTIQLQLFPVSERFNAVAILCEIFYWSRDGYSRLHLKFKTVKKCKQTLHLACLCRGKIKMRFTRNCGCALSRNCVSFLYPTGSISLSP